MWQILMVGVGGFVGAVARYGLSGFVVRLARGGFPYGTLVVNVLGCLVIGALVAFMESQKVQNETIRLFVVTGLLGSFTTFSTFGHETLEAFRNGAVNMGLMNIGLNVLLGLVAVLVGRLVVAQVLGAATVS